MACLVILLLCCSCVLFCYRFVPVCSQAEESHTSQYLFSLFHTIQGGLQGGLAARSGTEFTWSPQLRNLAEWDWVPNFLDNKHLNKYGGECRHERTMSFCSLLRIPASKHQLMEFLDIRRHDVSTVQGWLHFSWFGISASYSVMFKLREIYERLACSISYIFPHTAVSRLSSLS